MIILEALRCKAARAVPPHITSPSLVTEIHVLCYESAPVFMRVLTEVY